MAYYGYERLRPGDALGIDMSEITKKVGTDLRAYEKKKGDDKESVAKSNRDFAELLATMPSSYNAEFNAFLGEASSLYSTDAAQIQSDFANRRIDKRTHDIQMANLNSGGKMMVDSLTGYTALINDLEEKKEAGLLGKQDLYRLSQLQSFADLGNVTLVLDPESKQPSLVKVNEDGEAEAMLINQFFNDVNMKMSGPTDTTSLVSNALKQAGIQDITLKDGSQTIGEFAGPEADAALTNAAEAGLAQINQLMGYATANVITKDGKVINYDYAKLPGGYLVGGILDEEKLKKLQAKNPGIFYQDLSGTFHVSDADREIIIDNFKKDLKFASDYTEVQAKTTDLTVADNMKNILDITLAAQRSGLKINKTDLALMLVSAQGKVDYQELANQLSNPSFFTEETTPLSAAELKRLYDDEVKLMQAGKLDKAIEYVEENLFMQDGQFIIPSSGLGGVFTKEEIESQIVPLRLNLQEVVDPLDSTVTNFVVAIGNKPLYNLGPTPKKEDMEMLKKAMVKAGEGDVYGFYRRLQPDYSYAADVSNYILDPTE